MADGEVLINTKINTDGAKEDLKKLKQELKGSADTASESAKKIEKSFEDVELSEAAEGLGESFEKETKQAEKTIEELAAELPEPYRKAYERIEELRGNDETDQKTKAAQIAGVFKKLGQSNSDAMKIAWDVIKQESETGSRRVIDNLEDIAREAEDAGDAVTGKLGKALEELGEIPGAEIISGLLGGITGGLTTKALELLGDAARALVDFGKKAIEMASDLDEVQNVVDVTFTLMSDKVDEFSRNAMYTAGLSETMAKKYTGTFGAMAKSFGFTEKEAFEMSTTMTQLTGDVASFYNLDHDEAYTKLKSVFTGETEALKDLGVVMTQTALDQYAMEKGIGKLTAEMTEQEKVALRYQFVLEQLNDASGDFLRTEGEWANQTRLLDQQWETFQTSVGGGLKEFFMPWLQWMNRDLMPALIWLGDVIEYAFNPELPEEYAKKMDDLGVSMADTIVDANGMTVSQIELRNAIDATEKKVKELKQAYEEAREAAKKSIDQQIGLLTELETKSDKSAKEIVDNWKKQQAALQNYSKNLQKAIDMGLDEALVQQLSDGSQESMQILNEFVNGTGISVEDINREFQGVQKSKEIVAATMADIQTGTSRKLQQIAQDTKNQWGDMADVVGASVADMQEYIDSLTGRQVYVDVIGRYNGSTIPNVYGNAFGGGYNPYSFTGYSVDATSYVPYLAEGAVIPPNAPFTAVLGDQRSGYNLEGPEDMFRSIVREELGSASSEETNELLLGILQAIQSSRVISINGREVFEEMVDENNRAIQSYGRSPLR